MEIEFSGEQEIDSRKKMGKRRRNFGEGKERKREGEKKMRKSNRAKENITYEAERDSPRSMGGDRQRMQEEEDEEEDEKELKLNFIELQNSLAERLQREKTLNLGERKNNLKRKRKKKESRGEANEKKKKTSRNSFFPFYSP